MKRIAIPDRLVGYLKYKRRQYAFEYRDSESKLYLYSTKADIRQNDLFEWLSGKEDIVDQPRWVKEIQLKGVSADDRQVIFGVLENEHKYHGFITLDVRWLIYYGRNSLKDIRGFSAEGMLVDSCFHPRNAVSTTIKYTKDSRVKEILSKSEDTELLHCGEYRISRGVKVETSVREYAGTNPKNIETPIYARSRLEVTFNKRVNIDILLRAISNQNRFFQYIYYSKDAILLDYSLFSLTSDNLKDYFGVIRLSAQDGVKPSDEKKERVIDLGLFSNKQALVLDAIQKGEISLTYLKEHATERHKYSPERVMMIFSEFEREFRNVYGIDAGRNEKYHEMKELISKRIETLTKKAASKEKRYLKRIQEQFNSLDQPYEYRVKYAINDCIDIMSKTLMIQYRSKSRETVDGISNRMGKMRNGIAHSNPDFVVDAIHLQDIGVIERLIYAMRLKHIGLENDNTRKAIECLFKN